MSGMDDNDDEEVKWVGQGLDAPRFRPDDPQSYLEESNHPYSPFVGNALMWDSWVMDDGTTYEGLTREETPHGKGVLVIGNGYGGGIQTSNRGDRYEGEFSAGFAHGLGMYSSIATNEVYRGEWIAGKRDGCGVLSDLSPFYKLVEKGVDPQEAWEQTKDDIDTNAKWGTWQSDYFAAGPDPTGKFCAKEEIEGVVEELDSVVTRARMFQHKPDGDVTFSMMQDAEGKLVNTIQDPMHYPHGTKFLMPGPMGQCHPVPDDPALRKHLQAVQRNYARIFNQYNFDQVTPPGSDMEKAEKLWEKLVKQAKKEQKRQEAEEKRRLKRLDTKGAAAAAGTPKAKEGVDEDEDDDDEEDTLAAVDADAAAEQVAKEQQQSGAAKRPPGFRPTAFGSMSLGMSRASLTVYNALALVARKADKRRSLARPTRR